MSFFVRFYNFGLSLTNEKHFVFTYYYSNSSNKKTFLEYSFIRILRNYIYLKVTKIKQINK